MKHLNMAMVAALVLGQAAYGSVITYSAVVLGTSEVPPYRFSRNRTGNCHH
jgi:hypothetical protein